MGKNLIYKCNNCSWEGKESEIEEYDGDAICPECGSTEIKKCKPIKNLDDKKQYNNKKN